MDKILFYSTVLCTFAPLISIFALTPYISRKGSYFGVLLNNDAKKNYKIKKISRRFTYFAIITGCFLSFSQIPFMSYSALEISIFAYVVLCLSLYFINNRAIKNIIYIEQWDNMQKDIHLNYVPRNSMRNAISIFWYLIYLVIIGITVFLSHNSSTKYNYILPTIQCITTFIILVMHFIIAKSNYFADRSKIETSIENSIYFRHKWSIFTFMAGLSLNVVLALLQLNFLGILQNTTILVAAPFIITIIITGTAIFFAIRLSK